MIKFLSVNATDTEIFFASNSSLAKNILKCMLGFKIGDKIRYRPFNTKYTITGQRDHFWILDNVLLASDEDLILDLEGAVPDKPRKGCTCGSISVGSDRHSDWCDGK